MLGLIIVSNCEVSKVTVHSYRGGAFYPGRVSGDAETESGPGEGEGANRDTWLSDRMEGMRGQRDCEALSSGNRNLQQTVPYLEPVAGDKQWSDGIRVPSSIASSDRFLPSD